MVLEEEMNLIKKIIPFKIRLDNGFNNDISSMNLNIPGSFYTYQGKIGPVLLPCTKNIDEILEIDEVEYNSRKNYYRASRNSF